MRPSGVLVVQLPHPHPVAVGVSLAYLVYYVALSGYLTAVGVRRRRTRSAQEGQAC